MPSDDAVLSALATLRAAAQPWRSSVAATVEELRGILGGCGGAPHGAAHALGDFAAGRIDAARFAGLVNRTRPLEDAVLLRLRVAFDTLKSLADRGDEALLVVRVPQGRRLRDAVADALAEVGRAFGAAQEATLARAGRFAEERHGALHLGLPFARWTARERRLAPPLVVETDGADLCATDLAEFLDGNVRLAVVVRGECAPAPLVRLVTPGTFVMQTSDPAALARLATSPGPGVAALVPPGAAAFVHDPSAGRAPWDRVKVDRVPAEPPRRAVGRWSADQQGEELRQLAALATRPSALAVADAARRSGDAAAAADPAGRLAAWLLEASSGAGAQSHA